MATLIGRTVDYRLLSRNLDAEYSDQAIKEYSDQVMERDRYYPCCQGH